MSPREREMKRSINHKAVKVAGSESTYLQVTNATNIAQNTFPKYVRVLRLLFRSDFGNSINR